jgi:hypothetical protein
VEDQSERPIPASREAREGVRRRAGLKLQCPLTAIGFIPRALVSWPMARLSVILVNGFDW